MDYYSCVNEAVQSLSEAASEPDNHENQQWHTAAAQTYATLALAEAIKEGINDIVMQMIDK